MSAIPMLGWIVQFSWNGLQKLLLQKLFKSSVKAHQLKNGKREETLLLLNNAPTHPSRDILNEKDEFMKYKTCFMFLPSNVT